MRQWNDMAMGGRNLLSKCGFSRWIKYVKSRVLAINKGESHVIHLDLKICSATNWSLVKANGHRVVEYAELSTKYTKISSLPAFRTQEIWVGICMSTGKREENEALQKDFIEMLFDVRFKRSSDSVNDKR
uniref:Uncharacterized protein n=1 Tax=Glossina pallidipes TaxID=7398 RepID=A0A1B0A1F1_GLOPL